MSKITKYFCNLQYSQNLEQVLDGTTLKKGEFVEVSKDIYKKYKDSKVNISLTNGINMEAYRMFFKVEEVDIPDLADAKARIKEEEVKVEEPKIEEPKSEPEEIKEEVKSRRRVENS